MCLVTLLNFTITLSYSSLIKGGFRHTVVNSYDFRTCPSWVQTSGGSSESDLLDCSEPIPEPIPMLESIPIPDSFPQLVLEPIPELNPELIPELVLEPIPELIPEPIPGSESSPESTWKSQFAPVTESDLTPEMELALE